MIKIYLIKNTGDNIIDITNVVKEKSQLKKSIKNFAWVFDFALVRKKVFAGIEIGDVIVLKLDNKEIFSGVVIKSNISNLAYTVIDYAWYFNNSEEIYQFEDVESSIVVTKLIETFGGNVGNIDATSTMIDKFYFGKTLGAIIKEIISNVSKLENKDYRFFYRDTKFHFELSKKNKYLNKEYTPKKTLKAILQGYEYNGLDYIKKPEYQQSLEGVRNAIKVYKTSGKEYIQDDDAKDNESIKKYGLLQKLVSYKDNDLSIGKTTANNILSKNKKLKDKLSLELPILNEFVYDGDLLELEYSDYSIKGVYEITGITYSINSDTFSAKLELERVE